MIHLTLREGVLNFEPGNNHVIQSRVRYGGAWEWRGGAVGRIGLHRFMFHAHMHFSGFDIHVLPRAMLVKACSGVDGGTAGGGVAATAAAGGAGGAGDVVARCIASGALNSLLDNIDNIDIDDDHAAARGHAAIVQRCVALKAGEVPRGVVMYGEGGKESRSDELIERGGGSSAAGDGDPMAAGGARPPPIACTLSAHAERLLWDWQGVCS